MTQFTLTGLTGRITFTHKALFCATTIALLAGVITFIGADRAGAVEISNNPMETNTIQAPPIIMFIFDNSASMDNSTSTQQNGAGLYFERDSSTDVTTHNLFGTSDSYYYSDSSHSGNHGYQGPGGMEWERPYWQSRWYGFNTIFYNPAVTYNPWPNWTKLPNTEDANGVKMGEGGTPLTETQADLRYPRSNPVRYGEPTCFYEASGTTCINDPSADPSSDTYLDTSTDNDDYLQTIDLLGLYYNGLSNDTPKHGIIVDNADGEPWFTTSTTKGSWYEPTGPDPEFRGESAQIAKDDRGKAFFKPDILESRDYRIYAYRACGTGFQSNMIVTLDIENDGVLEEDIIWDQDATSQDTPTSSDTCGEWHDLFGKDYYLEKGKEVIVTYNHGTYTDTDGTTKKPDNMGNADAVYFVYKGETPEELYKKVWNDGNVTGYEKIVDNTDYNDKGAFLPPVEILNAHYYMVDDQGEEGLWDKDDNGVADEGEKVYLVNFVWSDDDVDGKVDNNEVKREYYLVTDEQNNGGYKSNELGILDYMKATELNMVNYDPDDPDNDDVPDSIQPIMKDEDGNTLGRVADYNDLQNFANWVMFYRKRIHVAKAAVALTLTDDNIEQAEIGFYALHQETNTTNYDGREPAVPINANTSDESIIDNGDTGKYVDTGSWNDEELSPMYDKDGRNTKSEGSSATWTPNIKKSGEYKVYGRWACGAKRDQNAKFTITHDGGETVKMINQRASAQNTITEADCEDNGYDSDSGSFVETSGCCGFWVDLGASEQYNFTQGNSYSVTVERHSESYPSDGSTAADAIKFVPLASEQQDYTDDLLDSLYSLDVAYGTPLKKAIFNIGQYYDQTDSSNGNVGCDSPYYSESKGGACQQAYTIMMTDGYPVADSTSFSDDGKSIGNEDGDSDKNGDGLTNTDDDNFDDTIYRDDYSVTIADIAMYYYHKDLSVTLPNEVPTSAYDKNEDQHMVTYTVAFGVQGTLPLDDLDNDKTPDAITYEEDPYFLQTRDSSYDPEWPDASGAKVGKAGVDDILHAAINGRGRFYQATNIETLTASLAETFQNIGGRGASAASVAVNSQEIGADTRIYQSTYESSNWTGDLMAYKIEDDGTIKKDKDASTGEGGPQWVASDQLTAMATTDRKIITFNGTNGIPFRYDNLHAEQKAALNNDSNLVDYLRGETVSGYRYRTEILGDIVHSTPLFYSGTYGDTIFIGANDGMLHGFNADTDSANAGKERFAYIPLHSFAYLKDLAVNDYSHRFFVDGDVYIDELTFYTNDRSADEADNDFDGTVDEPDEDYSTNNDSDAGDYLVDDGEGTKKMTLLVGGLGAGGRGIYALNVSSVGDTTDYDESALANGDSTNDPQTKKLAMWEYPPLPDTELHYAYATEDSLDNDNNGTVDDKGEMAFRRFTSYAGNMSADGVDNDRDGSIDESDEDYHDDLDNDSDDTTDEAGEVSGETTDDDMGYSFSDPIIVPTYKSHYKGFKKTDTPWVVLFGNGYKSKNGHAVLYAVNALTGELIRKIDTGAGPDNGLSDLAVIDEDLDQKADYVYAGDLLGNMWKFDLTDTNPAYWGSAFKDSSGNPLPLFQAPGQPITARPEVTKHPEESLPGHLVCFGTGKYLGSADIDDLTTQSVFCVWDMNTKSKKDPENNVGVWNRDNNTLNGKYTVNNKLLKQEEYDSRYYDTLKDWYRIMTDYPIHWYANTDGDFCKPENRDDYKIDGNDNDGNGKTDYTNDPDEHIGHVGWYFDLPFATLQWNSIDDDGDGTKDEADEGTAAGERVVTDLLIRNNKLIFISMIPQQGSSCSGGGYSILNEVDVENGGRTEDAVFDVNEDGVATLNEDSLIFHHTDDGDVTLHPQGIRMMGMGTLPCILSDPDTPNIESKYISTSAGTIERIKEKIETIGVYYWRER